jgi:MFS family permease
VPAGPGQAGAAAAPPPGFWAQFREGLTFLLRSRSLRAALTGMTATLFLVLAFDTLSPLVVRALGVRPSLLGVAVSGVGFGAVAGTIALGQWGQRVAPAMIMAVSQALAGSLVLLTGLAVLTRTRLPAVTWLPVLLLTGAAAAGIMMSFALTLQRETPHELLGRVSSTAEVIPTITQFIAPLAGAAVATSLGVGWVLAGAGAGLVAIAVIFGGPVFRALARQGTGLVTLAPAAEPDVVAHAIMPDPGRAPAPAGPPPRPEPTFFL